MIYNTIYKGLEDKEKGLNILILDFNKKMVEIFGPLSDMPATVTKDVTEPNKRISIVDYSNYSLRDKKSIALNFVISKYREHNHQLGQFIELIAAKKNILNLYIPKLVETILSADVNIIKSKQWLIQLDGILRIKNDKARRMAMREYAVNLHNYMLSDKLSADSEVKRIFELIENAAGIEYDYLAEQLGNPAELGKGLKEHLPEYIEHLREITNKSVIRLPTEYTGIRYYIDSLRTGFNKNKIVDDKLIQKLSALSQESSPARQELTDFLKNAIKEIEQWDARGIIFAQQVQEVRKFAYLLNSKYKELRLVKSLLQSKAVKRMLRFNEEYAYLVQINQQVTSGYKQKDWKQFRNIIDSSKDIKRILAEKYSDEPVGKMIFRFAKKRKYDLPAWTEFIQGIIRNEFLDPAKRKVILAQGKSELVSIISNFLSLMQKDIRNVDIKILNIIIDRMEILKKNEFGLLAVLKRYVDTELAKVNGPIRKMLRSMAEHKQQHLKAWELLKDDYLKNEESTAVLIIEVMRLIDEISRYDPVHTYQQLRPIMQNIGKWDAYIARQAKGLLGAEPSRERLLQLISSKYSELHYVMDMNTDVNMKLGYSIVMYNAIKLSKIPEVIKKVKSAQESMEILLKKIENIKTAHFDLDQKLFISLYGTNSGPLVMEK